MIKNDKKKYQMNSDDDTKSGDLLEKIILVDSADLFLNIFFLTRREFLKKLKKNKEDLSSYIDEKYEWDRNLEFLAKLRECAEDHLKKIIKFHNVEPKKIFFIRDSSRGSNWRKSIFPEYKNNRKNIIRHYGSKVNINKILNFIYLVIIPLLNKKYDFHLVRINNAEADDVIGVLTNYYANKYRITIISSDTDYLQLLEHKTVSIYNSRNENMECKLISDDDYLSDSIQHKIKNGMLDIDERTYMAIIFLFRKLIKGDKSDNISPCSTRKDEINDYLLDFRKFYEKIKTDKEILEKFERNSRLIDFTYIPQNIQDDILKTFKPYLS